MTENEYTIDELIDFMYNVMDDSDEEAIPFVKEAIQALEKVQAFESIGTIEEFKDLKEDGRFLEFLYNHIPPNEMEQYLSMYQMKDKVAVNGYADQSGLMPAT